METLIVERSEGIVTVTLNRPEKKNAINGVMWDELLATFTDIAARDEDRVVVVTGAGGAFCSGADLSSADDLTKSGVSRMRYIGSVGVALHRLAKPTIAAVGGVAAGAGLNLALGCDLILASDDARFSEIFHKRGLSIDFGGSWLLHRLIGLHRAKELAFFADVIPAEEAMRMGLVNRVVPADELPTIVKEWATRLASLPPIALSMTKTMLNNSFAASMHEALEDEARCQSVNFSTADFGEAVAAFLQKREPKFQGR